MKTGLVLCALGALVLAGCSSEAQRGPSADPAVRQARLGQQVYGAYCSTCHQASGQGLPGAFPPLTGTDWVLGDEGRLIRLVLNGMRGPVEVNGEVYDNVMTAHNFLTDDQIAAVLTYVRTSFGNDAPPVAPETVQAVRAANERDGLWEASALREATGVPVPAQP